VYGSADAVVPSKTPSKYNFISTPTSQTTTTLYHTPVVGVVVEETTGFDDVKPNLPLANLNSPKSGEPKLTKVL
jgi:hypothetical protein